MIDKSVQSFNSCGKLLITGEYAVLNGAKAFALPTRFGQSLKVKNDPEKFINWKAMDHHGKLWLEVELDDNFNPINGESGNQIATIKKIFQTVLTLNPKAITTIQNSSVETVLEFDRSWGLGSSSTLIVNISKWLDINPYELQFAIFGGSGYDVACAINKGPVMYQLQNGIPKVESLSWNPEFKDQLFFVHLNKKRNTRDAIDAYNSMGGLSAENLKRITEISEKIPTITDISAFVTELKLHEEIISNSLGIPTIKQRHFSEYPHAIKSLGAWGGDFIMCIGGEQDREFFRSRNFNTILSFSEMIL